MTCPICETPAIDQTPFCAECGWELDWSGDEYMLGDEDELRRELDRKRARLQRHRKLYEQAKRGAAFETDLRQAAERITALEQEHQQMRQRIELLEQRGAERPIKEEEFSFDVITVNYRGREVSRKRGTARQYIETIGMGVTLEMVAIPGGKFMMGSPEHEEGRSADESPQHEVTVAPFYMGKYPITQEQWAEVMHTDPSYFKGLKRPVENVSWEEAVRFCERLSAYTRQSHYLPSEAEWEYACRAGTTTPFHFGDTLMSDLANYDASKAYAAEPVGVYRQKTTYVGNFLPNAFGLYDMHGNVYEWCLDILHDDYTNAPKDGSAWLYRGDDNKRVLRGGAISSNPIACRSASRSWLDSDCKSSNLGFRVVAGLARN